MKFLSNVTTEQALSNPYFSAVGGRIALALESDQHSWNLTFNT